MSPDIMYDVIIIGGGITGAGIARDCALRGLKTILLEKNEPGRATTAASTHLIHGGLRYLLYDRLTTHTTCWDSGNIVRIARPLLTRLPVLWPVYRDHRHGIETVETLMESYDSFSRMKEGLPHLRLSAEKTLRLMPGLKKEGLVGAISFDEWWVDPVGLVNANLESAKTAGAEVRTGCAVASLLRGKAPSPPLPQWARDNQDIPPPYIGGRGEGAGNRITGVKILDASGQTTVLQGEIVINATGPWVDQVAHLAGARIPLRLRKGTHLVYDRNILTAGSETKPLGLLLEAEDRDRYIFIISVGSTTLVGPTDLTGPENPDQLATAPEEIRYLLASAKRYFNDFPERFDRTIIGARPILGQRGAEKLLSREYEIIDHGERGGIAGFITAAGGKMSDFRLMAQDATDVVCRKLDRVIPCRTAALALNGETLPSSPKSPRPLPWLKRFLRRHPHLRELHALTYLGAAFCRHLIQKMLHGKSTTTAQDFLSYYRD